MREIKSTCSTLQFERLPDLVGFSRSLGKQIETVRRIFAHLQTGVFMSPLPVRLIQYHVFFGWLHKKRCNATFHGERESLPHLPR